jgi:hypothetical protein
MRGLRLYLRSVPGQLALFGVVFLGAAVIAFVPYFFRERFFERHLKETYPDLAGYADQAARVLGSPHSDKDDVEKVYDELVKRDKKVTDSRLRWKNLDAIYGAWIQGDAPGDPMLLARRLVEFQPDRLVERVQRTLAAGDPAQRERAIDFLAAVAKEEGMRDDVIRLARAARTRALRRGEAEVAERAGALLVREGVGHGR